MNELILLVDDEPSITQLARMYLEREGFRVTAAGDGESALVAVGRQHPALVVLDVMLPKLDGFEVCRRLRADNDPTAIIMLTARAQEAEKELGLDSGADDYVTKPFSLRELRARIRAQLRRSARVHERICRFGDCEVDFDRAELRCSGRLVDVTPLELRLLDVFLRHPGRVLSREQLIELVWGHGTAITDRAVDTHVFNLRKKIEPVPSEPRFLIGVRGLGYRFEDRGDGET